MIDFDEIWFSDWRIGFRGPEEVVRDQGKHEVSNGESDVEDPTS